MAAAERRLRSHFAPPERADQQAFLSQVEAAAHSQLLDWVLVHVGGFLAVLNEERQVVALNDTLLTELGLADAAKALGLRPGEALRCVHAHDMEAGCGTSEFCGSCGAAIAIVGSLAGEVPVERTCAMTVARAGAEEDICLRVRAAPMRVGAWRFVLLFLQDITADEWHSALERTFFHDVNNLITGICGMGELMRAAPAGDRGGIARRIESLTNLLAREVAIQRSLSHGARGEYPVAPRDVAISDVLEEIRWVFANHAAARDRRLLVASPVPTAVLRTDFALLMRVLTNLLLNAFEATEPGGAVSFGIEAGDGRVVFSVRNAGVMPDAVRRRVFQRHFSTKEGSGRGIGTFSARLFGEKFLGGRVGFTSRKGEGTAFRLDIPASLT